MSTSVLKSTEQAQLQLHDSEVRGHLGTEVGVTIAVCALGSLIGSGAGDAGIVAGSLIGATVGLLAGFAFDRNLRARENRDHEIEAIEAEADRVIDSRRSGNPPAPR